MTTGSLGLRNISYRILARAIVMVLLGMPLATRGQQEQKPPAQKNDAAWKANAMSAAFPEEIKRNLRVTIEGEKLTCHSGDSTILDVPLRAISRITRDGVKEYPATEFLMHLATMPSSEHHTFGTKEYRDEMAGRVALGVFALGGLLFPKHKEMVLVSWKDESGEHDAEFHLEPKQGRAMLEKLQQETGLKPRDLEKERKDIEEGKKQLRRWIREQAKKAKQ